MNSKHSVTDSKLMFLLFQHMLSNVCATTNPNPNPNPDPICLIPYPNPRKKYTRNCANLKKQISLIPDSTTIFF